ncbi:hypothetical protein K466DRAFT_659175 [Polyporus arcularius HHB13444]|uniref:F-box domain-containing protein n=1 Tax=Polyporus arcularius HHB13444 TaxID=1314778 RepID=A0A5C3PRX8_9APHY|nr:hypothetical protein K466DRAFT_659175 [Polyporus arcularius HHB13444]
MAVPEMADSSRGLPPLPPDDLALLSGLQPHEVRAVAESKIQAYRAMVENINGYIIQLSTIQNTTVALHASLPPEVLINVFRHILPTCRSDLRLTHVCKLWRDLIFCTPVFWVDMLAISAVTEHFDHNTDSSLSFPSFVMRSSPLPYELNITGQYAFLLNMPSYASRIYSLSVHLPRESDSISYLTPLLNLHMPLLETMQCWAYGVSSPWLIDRATHRLPRGQNFPRLRKLALYGADLPSRALAFPYLEELTFDDGTYSDSLLHLLIFLGNCPQLRTLNLNIQARSWQAFQEHDAVSLPHLRICSLRIHENEGSWVHNFLERVHVPATAQLEINWLARCKNALSELIPSSPPVSVEVLKAINAVTIHFQYNRNDRNHKWVLSANGLVPGDPKPHLKLSIHNPCCTDEGDEELPSGALPDLAKLFTNSPSLHHLRLRLDSEIAVTSGDWCTILDGFSSLSSLTVHVESCLNLLAVLRRNPSRWPTLRRLSISCRNGSGVHEPLLSAIEKRAREGLGLKYLAFSTSYKKPLSAHRMRRLRELVEEVAEVDELEL